jgi:hypothetical protein
MPQKPVGGKIRKDGGRSLRSDHGVNLPADRSLRNYGQGVGKNRACAHAGRRRSGGDENEGGERYAASADKGSCRPEKKPAVAGAHEWEEETFRLGRSRKRGGSPGLSVDELRGS